MSKLADAFRAVIRITESEGTGDIFDAQVLQVIANECGLEVIDAETWKAQHRPLKSKTTAHNFRIDCPVSGNYIVDKPNGSQQWPDQLIILEQYIEALPIEIKAAAKTTVQWNSTYPKRGHIYVLHSRSNKRTTIALGDDLLSDEDRLAFDEMNRDHRALADKVNAKFKQRGSKASYFPRGKYDITENFFKDEKVMREREERALAFIEEHYPTEIANWLAAA